MKRQAPAHVQRAWQLWDDDTIVWESALETAANGWDTEAREYAERNPRPRFKDYLVAEYASMRALADTGVSA